MYGIFFLFNKDLRRILTDYGSKGNPLKKDFHLIDFLKINFNFF
jgi:NADH-quinone oxidoreductase subunit C